MGTRADFYIGRGKDAEWLGSIGFDGYPSGIDAQVLNCTSPEAFRHAVESFLTGDQYSTKPEQGWPWPWDDSHTTDFAYAFDDGQVWASCFGCSWALAATWEKMTEEQQEALKIHSAEFPDMKARKAVTLGPRSGLIVIGA